MQKLTNIEEIKFYRQKVKAKVAEEQQQNEADAQAQKPAEKKIPHNFVMDCLNANELGDGILYAAIHRDKFLYNASAGEWLIWQVHYWSADITGRSRAAVEAVACRYLEVAGGEMDQARECTKNGRKDQAAFHEKNIKKLQERVQKLRTWRGVKAALNFAALQLSVRGENLDNKPWLLACRNGVINLKTGKLLPGRQDQYLTRAASVDLPDPETPAAQAAVFKKTLLEIFDGDKGTVDFLQKLLGYGLVGITPEHIFPVFCGKGRNGKTLIIETILKILGPLAVTLNPETLLDQGRARNPAGPSPDVMVLKDCRLAFTSETDEGRRIAVSASKRASGGDTHVARNPHDKYMVTFTPTHLLILSTNHRPQAPAGDFAFWERIRLINFPLSFVDREPKAANERPAKKGLLIELQKEAPGILAWLVQGCLQWQRWGLKVPPSIMDATSEYHKSEDFFSDFIDECLEITDDSVETPASELYDVFVSWYERNVSKKGISQRRFGMLMKERDFQKFKRGIFFYRGLKIK